MRILLAAPFNTTDAYSYAQSFATTLSHLGHTVLPYNTKITASHRITQKIQSILLPYLINYQLPKIITHNAIDLLFIIKGNYITPRVLRSIKNNTSISIIHFHPDNPFTFWNGNSRAPVLESLPYIDCFLSWSHILIEPLMMAGCKNVLYFPFAFDETIFNQPIVITDAERSLYTADISFIGTWDPEREAFLTYIKQQLPSLSLKIWGNRWLDNIAKDSPLQSAITNIPMYTTAMIKIMQCSTINLNFIRKQNSNSHNMRTFEIPASKSFMLTQRTNEQVAYPFEENKSIACFSSQEELVNKILLFSTNADLRESITQKSWQCVQEYTLRNQLIQLFQRLREIK